MTDAYYMQRALELAAKGLGWVNPNPQVGAVITREGRIVAEGYHQRFGGLHAEREALRAATEPLKGATLYVTLEPCCHEGKTPPCTEAIIAAGISRVVIGSNDPNPLVAGKGTAQLRAAGIEVVCGCMQEECDLLNRIFFHYIQTKTPSVLLKYAMTADGKVATRTGASRWITGEEARKDVHRLRGRYRAIMVGIGTVLADDPLLTCRLEEGRNPLRVICDSSLKIPLSSQILQTARELPTLVVTTSGNAEKAGQLEEAGCEVVRLFPQEHLPDASPASYDTKKELRHCSSYPSKQRVDLKALMLLLGQREVDSVLIEGGPTLNGAALEAGIVQVVRCYLAPKLFGGAEAPSPIEGSGIALPSEAHALRNTTVRMLGSDLCIEGEVP